VLLSCAFATSLETPEHIRVAEALGYHRAWCYDSPALYPDVWVALALAAERTERIGLGPGVLVPSLRHPMTSAAAIATLASMAPGRVAVAVGSGFTGARCLGRKPMRWTDVADYVRTLRGLLRGEEVEWDGAVLRMLHPPGFAPPRPIEVEVLIAASGPKGLAAAAEVGDGVFLAGVPTGADQFANAAVLTFGTVLDDGEPVDSPRVLAAAGHGAAVSLHAMYEWFPAALDGVPGGPAWKAMIDAMPERTRHLSLHEDHLVGVNGHDRPFIGAELLAGAAFSRDQLRERLDAFAAGGATEVAYQPAGPDIPRELEVFASVATG
jgi:5,10-methylenetetrahydromethanopterin reductase